MSHHLVSAVPSRAIVDMEPFLQHTRIACNICCSRLSLALIRLQRFRDRVEVLKCRGQCSCIFGCLGGALSH